MPIVEYKNIRTDEGIRKPGYIVAGGRYRADDWTIIGYVPDNPKFWVPDGLKNLSKEEFVERQKTKIDKWDELNQATKDEIIEQDGEDRWEKVYDELYEIYKKNWS